MTTTFQPGSGDLLIRGPLTQRPDGVGLPSTSRYAWPVKSDGGSSLGSFPSRSSRNPFFARNNPHPSRVKHIKGLLDVPICTILDANHGESRSASQVSRFSLATPTTDQMRQRPLEGILKLPVNINAYRPKEKAIPTMGMGKFLYPSPPPPPRVICIPPWLYIVNNLNTVCELKTHTSHVHHIFL